VEKVGQAIAGGPLNFRMLGVAARAASFGTIGILGGAAVGLGQWFVLRGKVAKCGRWIQVNSVSLGAGLACGSLLADAFMLRTGSLASTAVLLLIGSSVAGWCTAKTFGIVFGRQLG
jgi:hypothetical protein